MESLDFVLWFLIIFCSTSGMFFLLMILKGFVLATEWAVEKLSMMLDVPVQEQQTKREKVLMCASTCKCKTEIRNDA